MKRMSLRKSLIAATLVGVTSLAAATLAGAQQEGYGPGYGRGPGMMGGYGPGGGGYGPGYGQGPGAGGWGPGGGYGPGMMGGYGGYGMGPGMMGGYGPGMMGGFGPGYGALYQLNLTPEQWNKINAIHEEQAKKNWDLAGKMREEAFKLRNLTFAEKRDRSAITNQYKKLQDLRLQRFQSRLDVQEKIDGVLTKEQKAQLRRFGPWGGQGVE